MIWDDLMPEQRAVIVCAIDESGLNELLYIWDSDWRIDDLSDLMERLGEAARSLLIAGLIEVVYSDNVTGPALSVVEFEEVVRNRGAWWTEEGLEVVVYLVLTDLGQEVLSTATLQTLYSFRDRPRGDV